MLPSPWRALRAVWRVAATLVHLLHGVAIVALRWPALDEAARRQRIAWWSRRLLRRMGLTLVVHGSVRPGAALVVANHVSWLDIATIHAVLPGARFVAQTGIRDWPLLGWLIAAVGTLFIERERKRDALRVVHHVAQALSQGQQVAVFPEGTTGAGPEPLPFHASLLQSAIASGVPVQPLALRYADARARFSPAVVWLGATTLVGSVWSLALAEGLRAEVSLLPAQGVRHADRRVLAQRLHRGIAAALAGERPGAERAAATAPESALE